MELTYVNHLTVDNRELTDVEVCGDAVFVTYLDLENPLQGGVLQYQLYSPESGTITYRRDIKSKLIRSFIRTFVYYFAEIYLFIRSFIRTFIHSVGKTVRQTRSVNQSSSFGGEGRGDHSDPSYNYTDFFFSIRPWNAEIVSD